MFKLYFLTSVADVVASVTLNYQLIRNSLEFENFFFIEKLKHGCCDERGIYTFYFYYHRGNYSP
jgi:hypothetical protein